MDPRSARQPPGRRGRDAKGTKLSPGEVYYVIFRQKWKILAAAVVGLLGVALLWLLTPTVFRSQAKLLVRYVRETTDLEGPSEGDRLRTPDARGANIINSEVEILSSPTLVEKTLSDLGIQVPSRVGAGWRNRMEFTYNVLDRLRVEVPRNSNVIRLAYDGPSPSLAQRILQTLIDNYLRKHFEVHRSAESYAFLTQQTDQLRARLAQTEKELRELKQNAGIVSLEESRAFIGSRVADLTRALQDSEVSLASAKAELAVIRAHPEQAAAAASERHAGGEAALGAGAPPTTLGALRARERELLATFTADSVLVRDIRRQISELLARQAASEAATRGTNAAAPAAEDAGPAVSQITRITSIEARIQTLKQQLEAGRADSRRLDEIEGRILELQRRKGLEEANYLYFSQNLDRAELDDALSSGRISNIKVVQPATLPVGKYRPNLARNAALWFAFSLLAGLGFAFFWENMVDHTLKRPTEAESHLELPVLLSFPVTDRANRLSIMRPRTSKVRVLTSDREKGAKVWDIPESLTSYEEALRDRLVKSIPPASRPPYLVGVTGCCHRSGVSTIAAGLAVALAHDGDERVLLVDADVSHANSSRLFDASPRSGMVDIFAEGEGSTSVLQPNLYLLSAHGAEAELPQASVLQGFTRLVRYMAEGNYQYVIFDMPPVTETSLVPRIVGMLSAVLLVIKAEAVRREKASQIKEILMRANGNVIGTVFNMRRFHVPGWLYRNY